MDAVWLQCRCSVARGAAVATAQQLSLLWGAGPPWGSERSCDELGEFLVTVLGTVGETFVLRRDLEIMVVL